MNIPSPLPDVPGIEQKSGALKAPPTNMAIRSAIVCLMLAASLNVVREITYVVGFLQATNGRWLDPDQMLRCATSFPILIIVAVVAWGLKRQDAWARRTAIIFSLLASLKVGWELYWLNYWRAQGYPRTEYQICILTVMVGTLLVAVFYLLSKNGREPFAKS